MPFDNKTPIPPASALAAMEPPKRIKRERSKGWRMPIGTVYVGRPTKWGNPYNWTIRPPMLPANWPWGRAEAVEAFELMLAGGWRQGRPPGYQLVEDAMRQLEGKDLACWCPLDQPCHADILLRYANATVTLSGDVLL